MTKNTEEARRRGAVRSVVSDYELNVALVDLAKKRDVRLSMLKGPYRSKPLSRIRYEAYALLRLMGGSYPQIGRVIGGRHHATVITGIRVFEKLKLAETEKNNRAVSQDNGRMLTVDFRRAQELGMVDDTWSCACCGSSFDPLATVRFSRAGETFCVDVEACAGRATSLES